MFHIGWVRCLPTELLNAHHINALDHFNNFSVNSVMRPVLNNVMVDYKWLLL